jgi:hypothetical protein
MDEKCGYTFIEIISNPGAYRRKMATEQNLYSDFHLKTIRNEQLGVKKNFY